MPDEKDFRLYKTIDEYGKTLEGNKYYHDVYLKAVNHPIRREILNIVNKKNKIFRSELISILFEKRIIDSEFTFNYNMDYLAKALCVNVIKDEKNGEIYYEITQSGKVIDYLK